MITPIIATASSVQSFLHNLKSVPSMIKNNPTAVLQQRERKRLMKEEA